MRVDEVRAKIASGAPILLVCAYRQPEAWPAKGLEEAVSFQEFERRRPELPKDYEIVFY